MLTLGNLYILVFSVPITINLVLTFEAQLLRKKQSIVKYLSFHGIKKIVFITRVAVVVYVK